MSLECIYLDNDCLILFLIVGSARDLVFYDKIFRKIKVYKKYLSPHFTVIVSNVHSNYYNDLIKLLQSVLVILLCRYKRYNICLNSFFSLYELFLAFICANNTERLVNGLSGVKIFNLFPFLTSSSSTPIGGIGGITLFWHFSLVRY